VKNITVSVPDDAEFARLAAQQRVQRRMERFSASDRLDRDAIRADRDYRLISLADLRAEPGCRRDAGP
jgi:hypothetical protein